MLDWVRVSIAFFAYVIVVAPFVPRLPARRRGRAAGAAAAGLAVAGFAGLIPASAVLHAWILPPALLLIAYWSSGLLFAAPMPRAERVLDAIDHRLQVDRRAGAMPRVLAEILELAYFGVYLLIPIALAIDLFALPVPDPERFWTVILATDFVCFGFLPWIQTRPPRAFRSGAPWTSTFRRLNVRVLRTASIQVNTVPSGHAAEALAAALLVSSAGWPVATAMGIAAALVSAGAVFGRYHYAADILLGWVTAAAVWWVAA